jgi:hypothetical protein
MREAQRVLGEFLPLVDWSTFRRRSLDGRVLVRAAASGAPLRLAVAGPSRSPRRRAPGAARRARGGRVRLR